MTWFRDFNPLMLRTSWFSIIEDDLQKLSRTKSQELIEDRKAWCEENCRARWSYDYIYHYERVSASKYAHTFFFKNKKDAMLFKLTFVGT
jgi:hypothetical protein